MKAPGRLEGRRGGRQYVGLRSDRPPAKGPRCNAWLPGSRQGNRSSVHLPSVHFGAADQARSRAETGILTVRLLRMEHGGRADRGVCPARSRHAVGHGLRDQDGYGAAREARSIQRGSQGRGATESRRKPQGAARAASVRRGEVAHPQADAGFALPGLDLQRAGHKGRQFGPHSIRSAAAAPYATRRRATPGRVSGTIASRSPPRPSQSAPPGRRGGHPLRGTTQSRRKPQGAARAASVRRGEVADPQADAGFALPGLDLQRAGHVDRPAAGLQQRLPQGAVGAAEGGEAQA